MNRRTFLASGAALTGLVVGGAGLWVAGGPDHKMPATIAGMMTELNALDGKNLTSEGQWRPAEVFEHCAQSIELSMTAYPEHKSDAFKSSIGALAFSLFAAKGSMKHSLKEAIPGAAPLSNKSEVSQSLARLKKALDDFMHYQGPLAEHFAYGELSKADYELAHVMHIADHMREIKVA